MKYWSMVAFASLFFSSCGWGYIMVRSSPLRDKVSISFLSVTGIALLTFLGGVLNLVRMAYPVILSALLLSGLFFYAIRHSGNLNMWFKKLRAKKFSPPTTRKRLSGHVLPSGILIAAICFYAFTLLPAAAFNYGDDFQTYIPRALRMLQTGTMTGDPFELLGRDLGAQAFFHGFVLLGFPVEYLFGFDAVFGFSLTGLLLLSIGKKFNLHWSYTTLALLAFIVINPQAVNISALYIGSAIILGILYASCLLFEQLEKSDNDIAPIFSAGILGLLLAASIAIKTSFLSYVFAYSTVFFIGLFLISKDKKLAIKAGSMVISSASIALIPWLALHATNYKPIIQKLLHPVIATTASADETVLPLGHIPSLFSSGELFYGGSYLSYGLIVLTLFIAGGYSLLNVIGSRMSPTQRGYLLVSLASCTAGILSYFFNAFYTVPESAVRYSCPVLIAALPFAWMAVSMSASNTEQPAQTQNLFSIKMAAMASLLLLVAIPFFSNFISRINRAYFQRMTLSFPIASNYRELIRHTISPDAGHLIRKIQLLAQPGQKILSLIDMPGHLDFSRNEIYSTGDHGLNNPWVDMPFNENVSDMTQYLKELGIRYIMWEYKDDYGKVKMYQMRISGGVANAYAYRSSSEKALHLRKMLTMIIMKGGGALYNANGIVLFDLQQVN